LALQCAALPPLARPLQCEWSHSHSMCPAPRHATKETCQPGNCTLYMSWLRSKHGLGKYIPWVHSAAAVKLSCLVVSRAELMDLNYHDAQAQASYMCPPHPTHHGWLCHVPDGCLNNDTFAITRCHEPFLVPAELATGPDVGHKQLQLPYLTCKCCCEDIGCFLWAAKQHRRPVLE
jgi:hypothetical protein